MAATAAVAAAGAAAEEAWERLWAPYDEPTYQAVLAHIRPEDAALEIGAGDLRLAYRLAERARIVYAIEINRALASLAPFWPPPNNLRLIWADAYHCPFPEGITVGVLLMRHCRHFAKIADKLREIGCRRLITNARWRLGVEFINLQASRLNYASVSMGWYACWCGATGFVPGEPAELTPEREARIFEVEGCPACHL